MISLPQKPIQANVCFKTSPFWASPPQRVNVRPGPGSGGKRRLLLLPPHGAPPLVCGNPEPKPQDCLQWAMNPFRAHPCCEYSEVLVVSQHGRLHDRRWLLVTTKPEVLRSWPLNLLLVLLLYLKVKCITYWLVTYVSSGYFTNPWICFFCSCVLVYTSEIAIRILFCFIPRGKLGL